LISLLLDTHAWAWAMTEPRRIPKAASDLMAGPATLRVSPVSFFEIAQKVRLGKWPEMAGTLDGLEAELVRQGSIIAPLTESISLHAGRLDWPHRDPFDRMIAATALHGGDILISADTVFDALPIRRIW
jgi:PIN domain nuclease of toxin-antitoxin system